MQTEGLVRNIGSFARFLEVISFSHANPVNLSNIARATQASRKTVEGYLEVLEDLLLSFRLPVFTRRAGRQLVSHPKLYLFDAGVCRSLRPRGPLDRAEEITGAALEGLVAQHLRAWIAYSRNEYSLHYWRTRAGAEVDFVVYGASGFWAIEVKNAERVHSADGRSLRNFREDYPEAEPLLLYRGHDHAVVSGIRTMPVTQFLAGVRPERSLT